MRTNVVRCVLITLTAVVLSGCYSDGHWTVPWKTSPFQSSTQTTPVATPGTVGSPAKPSGIATSSSTNNTTAPSSGYASRGAGTAVPPVTSTGHGKQLRHPEHRLSALCHDAIRHRCLDHTAALRPPTQRALREHPVYGTSPSSYYGHQRALRFDRHGVCAVVRHYESLWKCDYAFVSAAVPPRLRTARVPATPPTAPVRARLRTARVPATPPYGRVRARLRMAGFHYASVRHSSSTPPYGAGSTTPPYGAGSSTPSYGAGSTTPPFGASSSTPPYGSSTPSYGTPAGTSGGYSPASTALRPIIRIRFVPLRRTAAARAATVGGESRFEQTADRYGSSTGNTKSGYGRVADEPAAASARVIQNHAE